MRANTEEKRRSVRPSSPTREVQIKLEVILAQASHFFRNPVVVGLALVFSVLHLALTRARALQIWCHNRGTSTLLVFRRANAHSVHCFLSR